MDQKLKEIMVELFEMKENAITDSLTMKDTDVWDSLKHIQLIMTIEEKFNITIDFTDSIEMTSIPIIKNKILKYLNDK